MEKIIKFEGDDDQPELLHANAVDEKGMINIAKSAVDYILAEIKKANPEKEGLYCGGCIKTILFNVIVGVINRSDATPKDIAFFGESMGEKIDMLAFKHRLRSALEGNTDIIKVIRL